MGAAARLAVVACLCATAAAAAPAADPPWPGGPGWSGVWIERNSILYKYGAIALPGPAPTLPTWPMKGDYAARQKAIDKAVEEGAPQQVATAGCMPAGMPYVMRSPYTVEILTTPGQLTFISEFQSEIRRIYADGRGHPPELEPSYSGHSIGHWEGRTLIVDTVGLRPETALDLLAPFHSPALRISERWRMIEGRTLEDRITVIDPEALQRPVEFTKLYDRAEKGTELGEFVCENNRDAAQAR